MTAPTRISVRTQSPYDVLVGAGILDRVPALLGDGVAKVAVIAPASVASAAASVRAQIEGMGAQPLSLAVPEGEAAKSAVVAAGLWAALGEAGFTRTDAIVGVGGGSTTDLAGFVAATWLRGVRLVNVPTTVLGMVDAAVGGKTGINTEAGKNLVGAIHEPAGVLCDLTLLQTLPRADLVSGLAEAVKCGFIKDLAILDLVRSSPEACVEWDSGELREVIERAIRVKADVVAEDVRESLHAELGRQALNYGHTFGHAIERVEGFRWRHGDAISVGMVYVAELARLAGILDATAVAVHRETLASLGLPISYATGRWDQLLAAMRMDKKARGDLLRFVVVERMGHPGLLEGPSPDLLEAAYAEVSA